MTSVPDDVSPSGVAALAKGLAVWVLAWAAMVVLDGRIDLANQALCLVLAAALASVWLPPVLSMAASTLAVATFNVAFVPPRGSLDVDVKQHALLLLTMLAVSWIVAALMARQQRLAGTARQLAQRAGQLQALGEALRDAEDPRACGAQLQAALAAAPPPAATPVLLLALQAAPDEHDATTYRLVGTPDADQRAGLWLSLRHSQAMGPGTGRHEDQPAWYLPMRGRRSSFGAAMLPLPPALTDAAGRRVHAQALCDRMGLAIERAQATQAAAAAREEAQSQRLRNTLLAAISHDHRTPLATILGAASALQAQAERLSPAQRATLVATIVDESAQLARLTDNTLQLARLDSPGLALRRDWESMEEIVGTALRRLRQRDPSQRIKARLAPGLPLLRCDAVLMVQLLDNLVDNALKYGGAAAPVEILVRPVGERLLLAVRDRGPGIAPAWRERIFDAFQRVDGSAGDLGDQGRAQRGCGVGLALCRAIARAHGGELTVRARGHGGSSFECSLPVEEAPGLPAPLDARTAP
jgi:two-component system sensor histidine kinase KdpD